MKLFVVEEVVVVEEVGGRSNFMRFYCLLIVRSDDIKTASNVFLKNATKLLDLEDMQSELNLKIAARWIIRSDLPRYQWTLNSLEKINVAEIDIYKHIYWLLSQMKESFFDSERKNIECSLSFFWSSRGTGGGPVITPELSELLFQKKIKLDIGFYFTTD